jgi:hypothetical protein
MMRLTNWYTHAVDNRYHVFEFRDTDLANEFASDLQQAEIPFERAPAEAEEGGQPVERFGIHRSAFKEALRINHLLHGRYRQPFIPHLGLRWFMLLFTAAVVLLALIGWWRS